MDISGPNLKKLLSGVNFPSSKVKKTHSEKKNVKYFGKWKFLAPSLKNSYISGGNLQSLKNKFLIFLEKVLPYFGMIADQIVK